jgi:hypothetical protein
VPPRLRDLLAGLHQHQAFWLSGLRACAQALPHADRVVALCRDEKRDRARSDRARLLALAGEHVRASDEAVALAAQPGRPREILFALAATHALAARVAAEDDRLGPQRRKDTADLYARRAVGLLRELHAGGAFRTANTRTWLRESSELKALHERDDFRKLLAEVEGTQD